MTMSDRKRKDPGGELAREAFARAQGSLEPRLDRLAATVPAMLAEAQRRRRLAESPAARISSAASSWLPRMAAAAALLVGIAVLWPASQSTGSASVAADASSALDSYVVSGAAPSSVPDPVMDALVR